MTVANAFVKGIVCKFGVPESILTDQGTNFMSDVFTQTCKLLRINKINCTAYHPESNGQLERNHRTLGEYLRHFVDSDQRDWDDFSEFYMFTFHNTPHTATSFTPFELVFGHTPILPTSITNKPEFSYNYDDYVTDLKQTLRTLREKAREILLDKKEKTKFRFDKNINPREFKVGEQVLLHCDHLRRGRSKKLSPIWEGPYTVISKDSPVNYTIKLGRNNTKVHANRLKSYVD